MDIKEKLKTPTRMTALLSLLVLIAGVSFINMFAEPQEINQTTNNTVNETLVVENETLNNTFVLENETYVKGTIQTDIPNNDSNSTNPFY